MILRSILRNKLRTSITIMGAAVGIAIFVSLTSVSNGFKEQIEDIMNYNKIDLVIQSKGSATPYGSRISMTDYNEISSMKEVESVSGVVMGPINSSWNPYQLIIGLPSKGLFTDRIGILEGRMLEENKKEIVIGEKIVLSTGFNVGNKIVLSNSEVYNIVGIYKSMSNILNGAIIFDINDAKRLLRKDDSINMIFIRLREGFSQKEVVDKINSLFPHLYAERTGNFVGQLRLIKVINMSSNIVSFIALIASCLVIMNTLLISISERTKEIGILMAIGWSKLMIMKIVVFESLLICFLGGIIGTIAGFLLLSLVSYFNPEGLGWWISASNFFIVFFKSILLALLLGFISALYPAFVASKFMPAEALRYE